LLKKSGSQSVIVRFRQMVKHFAEHDHLPDYRVTFDEESDQITFYNRESWWENAPLASDGETLPPLPAEAYEEGRAAAPGYDIHRLESKWREWWASSGKPNSTIRPRHSSAAAGAATSGRQSNGITGTNMRPLPHEQTPQKGRLGRF